MSFAAALGTAILQALVTGTLVAIATALVARRRRSAAGRHAVELLGLVVMALVFVGHVAAAVRPQLFESRARERGSAIPAQSTRGVAPSAIGSGSGGARDRTRRAAHGGLHKSFPP